jgi:hypothetical protein
MVVRLVVVRWCGGVVVVEEELIFLNQVVQGMFFVLECVSFFWMGRGIVVC